LVKIDATDLPCFSLAQSVDSRPGTTILAFSNLYGIATGNEPVSVQRGIIAAHTKRDARRGISATAYREQVYLLDAITNNPGAAGGAVTDSNGQLIGLIGKELKDQRTNQWLNFAIPVNVLANSVEQIRHGKMVIQSIKAERLPTEPITPRLLGLVLVPDIVSQTPPFVDRVITGSPADRCGLRPDDLIIEINGNLTPSIQELHRQFSQVDRDDSFEMTVQRKGQFEAITIGLLK
jgi:serine protease Do